VTPKVSVVIVSFNTREDLLGCLASLEHAPKERIEEVVVVDNASGDGSVEAVGRLYPQVRVLANPENVGFARANNQGLRASCGRYVLFLNSDAELRPGALEALSATLERCPEVGIAGPRTLNTDGTVQVSYGPPLSPLAEWKQRRKVRAVTRREPGTMRRLEVESRSDGSPGWVSGSCLLARRETLEAISGFDERFFLYEEDVDLCLRARRAGWEIAYVAGASVVHHLGRSAKTRPSATRLEYQKSHLLYYHEHNGRLWTGLLRAYLGARAVVGLLGSLRGGDGADEARRFCLRLASLAWRGR
jgi:GT2 family glycosyltransferase